MSMMHSASGSVAKVWVSVVAAMIHPLLAVSVLGYQAMKPLFLLVVAAVAHLGGAVPWVCDL
jgi:hypothetical protein